MNNSFMESLIQNEKDREKSLNSQFKAAESIVEKQLITEQREAEILNLTKEANDISKEANRISEIANKMAKKSVEESEKANEKSDIANRIANTSLKESKKSNAHSKFSNVFAFLALVISLFALFKKWFVYQNTYRK